MRKLLVIALALALCGGLGIAQPPPVPLVKVEGLKPVSAHVQVIPDDSVPLVPNVGFVVGDKGLLVVETGLGPKNGAAVYGVARRLAGGKPIFLVTTHVHPEHDLGAQSFPASVKLIRARAQTAEIAANGLNLARAFSARSPDIADLLKGAEYRPADISFDADYRLELGGGVIVQLIALGPNHTDGDTAIWVPGDKVLFSGDVAMRAQPAMMAKTSVGQWMRSLDRLEALKPAVVIPSHGPLGDVGFIQGYRAYIAEVRDRTAKAKAGGADLTAATAQVSEAMKARYPDAGRLSGAVRVAFGAP
ncbi:MAG TPA: MBL fold metallo-hydrolase [Caulobacteraceae bacterium]|nr:MBL fold metallo-hydrolase [Caulobacteraceae bacterium]